MVQNSHCMNFHTYFWKISLILVQSSYFMSVATYFWRIKLFWYKIRTLWVAWHISKGLTYFGTKFVLYEFWDIFPVNLTILVQNLYFMRFGTYFWRIRLFWYKIRTVWILRNISEGFHYFGTKLVPMNFETYF